jgi:hypothetical protein
VTRSVVGRGEQYTAAGVVSVSDSHLQEGSPRLQTKHPSLCNVVAQVFVDEGDRGCELPRPNKNLRVDWLVARKAVSSALMRSVGCVMSGGWSSDRDDSALKESVGSINLHTNAFNNTAHGLVAFIDKAAVDSVIAGLSHTIDDRQNHLRV